MSTEIMMPDSAPDYLKQYTTNPVIMAANAAMIAGISPGMHPMIGTNGTRFVKKEGGAEEVIMVNDAPIAVLGCVVLSAKTNLDKKYYASAYDPKAPAVEPDCQSSNGTHPDAGVPNKQNETCAGCWANLFGSAVGQNGQPAKGKACSDTKKLAIFAAGKVYGFAVPPASLKNWQTYVRDLQTRGIPLQYVITNIGFDIETPQILTFKFGGLLAAEKIPAVNGLIESKEVNEIITFKLDSAPALPAPATAAPPQIPAQTAAAQPAAQAPPAPTRAPRAGKQTAAAAAAQPAAAAPAADANADPLGLGVPQIEDAQVVDPAPALNEAAIGNLLGI